MVWPALTVAPVPLMSGWTTSLVGRRALGDGDRRPACPGLTLTVGSPALGGDGRCRSRLVSGVVADLMSSEEQDVSVRTDPELLLPWAPNASAGGIGHEHAAADLLVDQALGQPGQQLARAEVATVRRRLAVVGVEHLAVLAVDHVVDGRPTPVGLDGGAGARG